MFVRKRKAARKKRKQVETAGPEASMPEEYAGEEEGDGEADRDTPSYAEHQFTFEAFEKVCHSALIRSESDSVHSVLPRKRWSIHW